MMIAIAMEYGRAWGGIVPGAAQLAADLMKDDPATFKAGYSRGSALLTALEAFEVDPESALAADVEDALDARLAS